MCEKQKAAKAAEGIRTLDLVLTKDALYRLSYSSLGKRVKGIEPSSLAWKAMALPLSYTRRQKIGDLKLGDEGFEPSKH